MKARQNFYDGKSRSVLLLGNLGVSLNTILFVVVVVVAIIAAIDALKKNDVCALYICIFPEETTGLV